jgi:hypothetical protein
MATLPPSVSQLSRQCGILNISQPHSPPRPVTGIALLFYFTGQIVETDMWRNVMLDIFKESTSQAYVQVSAQGKLESSVCLHIYNNPVSTNQDRLCGLVVRVPGRRTDVYCASCEVRTEFIYVM